MFSSRLFRDPFFNTSFSARPSPFESDPFFSAPQSTTQVSEAKDYDEPMKSQQEEDQGKKTPATTPRTARPAADRPHHSQQVQQHQPQQQQLMDPFADPWLGGGFGSFGLMGSMMDRMQRMMGQDWGSWDAQLPADGTNSSYSCSSSSFTQTDADGKSVSHSTRSERRRVGDVIEEETRYRDHLGNERIASKRGLGNQRREIIEDVNAKGERRKVENLRGIKPEEVAKFDSAWQTASQKFDPQHRLLNRPAEQPQLKQEAQPRLTQDQPASKAATGDVKPAAEKSAHATPPKQSRTVNHAA